MIRWGGRENAQVAQLVLWATSQVTFVSKICLDVRLCTCLGGRGAFSIFLYRHISCWNQRLEDFIGKVALCTSPKSPNLLDVVPSMLRMCVQALITSSLHTLLVIVYQKQCENTVAEACCAINDGFAVPNMSHSVTWAETAVDRRLNCSATADTRIKCEISKLPHNLHRNINMWHQRLLVFPGMHSHSGLSLGRIFLLEKSNTDLCNSFQILHLFWSYGLLLPSVACSPYPSSSWDPHTSAYGQVCTYWLWIVF